MIPLSFISSGVARLASQGVLIVACALLALVPMRQCTVARREAYAANLRADSVAAVADTSRLLQLQLAQLGDSLHVMERRVVQHAPETDAVSRALGLEPTTQVDLKASIGPLNQQVKSDTVWLEQSDSVRAARFDVRQPPFTARAEVALPQAPLAGTLALHVDIDTAHIALRLGCGPAGGGGVRPANVAVIAPSWLTVKIASAEQTPEICSAVRDAAVTGLRGLTAVIARRVGVAVGYALVPAGLGPPVGGVGIMLGVKVWP